MSDTRTRGITLQRLITTSLAEAVVAKVREGKPEDADRISGVTFGVGDLAITEHKGTTYVICSEGVGWEVSEAEPLELSVYVEYGPSTMTIVPSFTLTLSPSQVAEYLPKGDDVDLADFIRAFGGRLEENFRIWERTLSA